MSASGTYHAKPHAASYQRQTTVFWHNLGPPPAPPPPLTAKQTRQLDAKRSPMSASGTVSLRVMEPMPSRWQ
jgi:hypothetical protein